MRLLPIAAALVALPAATASAATLKQTSVGVPLPQTHDLLVTLVNSCAGEANYIIAVKDGVTGLQLFQRKGVIAIKRAAEIKLTPRANYDAVFVAVTVICDGSVMPQPRTVVAPIDRRTGVPGLIGDVQEGTGI